VTIKFVGDQQPHTPGRVPQMAAKYLHMLLVRGKRAQTTQQLSLVRV
jgi:hypothetical protein